MSSACADDGSTIAPSSRGSIRREVDAMFKVIKKERNDKNRCIIAVVRPEAVDGLKRACETSRWKFWTGKTSLFVTTEDQLQETAESVCDDSTRGEMMILFSSNVNEIYFSIKGSIKTLVLLRSGHGQVLIMGDSTFNDIRLDTWQEKRHKHQLYLGPGISIQVSLGKDSSWVSAMRNDNNLSKAEKAELKTHLQAMEKTDMNGKWWHEWKAPVAGVFSLAIASARYAAGIKAVASGVILEYKFGLAALKAGAAAVKTSTMMTAAGPAVLLGVGIALAVYKVPWNDVFSWIKSFFAWLWDWISKLWAKFKSWLGLQEEKLKVVQSQKSQGKPPPLPKPL